MRGNGTILEVVSETMGDPEDHMEVLKLLQSQNRSLRKLLTYSQEFLASSWDGSLATLQLYEAKRAVILRAMTLYDHKIEELVSALTPEQKTPALIQEIRSCWVEKDQLCKNILELDRAVMKMIRNEQQRLTKLVADNEKSKNLMNRFKSTWVPESGESLDGKV